MNALKMPEDLKEVHFPKAGVDVSQAFWRQPNKPLDGKSDYARTTRGAINCRGFEATTNRNRGGIRPGLSKFLSVRPGDVEFITQELALLASTQYPPFAGTLVQSSQSGRVVTLVAVSQGNVYAADAGDTTWTAATNTTSNTPPLNYTGVVFSALLNQKLWFADGINQVYYDRTTNTVNPWTIGTYAVGDIGDPGGLATGQAKGEFPSRSNGTLSPIICTWRARIVLAIDTIIYMSAVGDPQDFDYSPPSQNPAQAFSGEEDPQGVVPDIVTSLFPYSDDTLFVGGDHTIHLFRGDPMSGGRLDLVTDAIGTAFGLPICKDPYGTLYFFSNRTGIYSLVPGQHPQRISQQIDPILQDIDTGRNSIRMVWSDLFQGLHVFVTPLSAPADALHYFWEMRSNAWWIDHFANTNHNPLTCCVFDGNLSSDRMVLLGSWDGVVRALDHTADDDDGTPIEWRVLVGPIANDMTDEFLFKDIQGVLAAESNDVDFAVLIGPTPEMALDTDPVLEGTWKVSDDLGGRNLLSTIRRAGHALYVELSGVGPMALEQMRIRIAPQGKVRMRGR